MVGDELELGVDDLQLQSSLLGEVEEGGVEGIRFPVLPRAEGRHGCSALNLAGVLLGTKFRKGKYAGGKERRSGEEEKMAAAAGEGGELGHAGAPPRGLIPGGSR